jgi:hypothetical protein
MQLQLCPQITGGICAKRFSSVCRDRADPTPRFNHKARQMPFKRALGVPAPVYQAAIFAAVLRLRRRLFRPSMCADYFPKDS